MIYYLVEEFTDTSLWLSYKRLLTTIIKIRKDNLPIFGKPDFVR